MSRRPINPLHSPPLPRSGALLRNFSPADTTHPVNPRHDARTKPNLPVEIPEHNNNPTTGQARTRIDAAHGHSANPARRLALPAIPAGPRNPPPLSTPKRPRQWANREFARPSRVLALLFWPPVERPGRLRRPSCDARPCGACPRAWRGASTSRLSLSWRWR